MRPFKNKKYVRLYLYPTPRNEAQRRSPRGTNANRGTKVLGEVGRTAVPDVDTLQCATGQG